MSETLIINYLIKGRAKMNVEELVQKTKDLIEEDNMEYARQFIEKHRDGLDGHYYKITVMLAGTTTDDLLGKIKGLFQ